MFAEINEQTGYSFFYRDSYLRNAGRLTLEVTDMPLEDVLSQCFVNIPVDYQIVDNTVVIKPKEEKTPAITVIEMPQEQLRLTGTVKDRNGIPLQSAAVIVKGTTIGASTDAEGNFVLYCPVDSKILEISILGMKTLEVVIGGRTSFTVVLDEEAMDIDEVQVIAYGTTTKRLNTGTIATVKSEDIVSRPVTNVLQALQGQVAGVALHQQSTGLGSPVDIVVRGQNSFSSGTNPLIIVDGVVVNSSPGGLIADPTTNYTTGGTNFMTGGVSPLNFINPGDIESIDILKDADATSIYGSRASNGVILITTKKAVFGETKYTFNASTGLSTPAYTAERMGTPEYLQMRKDAFAMGNASATSAINPITPTEFYAPDLLVWDQAAYTDWTDYSIGNTAPVYSFDGQITGGNKTMNYLASAGYTKKYDVQPGKPYQERLVGRMVLGHTSADNRLKIDLSSTFGYENQSFTYTSFSNNNLQLIANVPNFEIYNEDGSVNIAYGKYNSGIYFNPVPMSYVDSYSKTGNLLLSADLSYEIAKGLRAKALISYNLQNNNWHRIFPSTALSAQTDTYYPYPFGAHTTNTFNALNIEPILTYDRKVAKGNLSLLAGATMLRKGNQMTGITVNDPGSDALLYSFASGNPTVSNSNETYYKFASLFGRATYNWDDKYLINFTFRRDGSSRFGPENKFGNFGSTGLAWIFTQEDFISNSISFLSFGKLRGSYGTTGSDNIADYLYTTIMQSSTSYEYATNDMLSPAGVANPGIQWEKTAKMDIGLDLGFLSNRIMFNTTWYRTISDNLLTSQPLPSQSGFSSYTVNFEGTVQNTGMEFQLTTHNLGPDSKLQWRTTVNLSFNENKLIEFPGLEGSSYSTKYEIGRAIPTSASYFTLTEMPLNFTGIDPATGLPQFKDVNGDGVVNNNDGSRNEAWIGTSRPTTWGGIGNYLIYKGLGFDFFIQFSEQTMTMWNWGTTQYQSLGSLWNPPAELTGNYWKEPGDVTKYPRLYSGVAGTSAYTTPINQYYGLSSAGIWQGFYWRLKNVQLTYTLPGNLLAGKGIDNLMFYIRGENLAVYTTKKLYKDPEPFFPNTAPVLRTFITGLQLTF